jgi:DnaJ-class molecular chaperone
MTDKQPRFDDGDCEWCNGRGWWDMDYPTREEDPTWGQKFRSERRTCDRCGGSGHAKFNPDDVSARTRDERAEAIEVRARKFDHDMRLGECKVGPGGVRRA